MSEWSTLGEGEYSVYFMAGNPTPIGAELPGDHRHAKGSVVRLLSPDGLTTIHVVTDAHYEEGVTRLSFLEGVSAV